MTTEEKLLRDIDTLRESLRLAGQDLRAGANLATVIEHGKWCHEELAGLLKELEMLKQQQDSHEH